MTGGSSAIINIQIRHAGCMPCRTATRTGEIRGTWVLAVSGQEAAIAAAMEQAQHLHDERLRRRAPPPAPV